MKLLYLVTDDWFFWSHRLNLARAARDAGCEVVVAASPGEHVERIEAEGFRFHPVAFHRRLHSQALNAGLVVELARLYRLEKPDLVHHVALLPIVYGSAAARLSGVRKLVQSVTGLGHAFISEERSVVRWLVERAYRTSFGVGEQAILFENPDDLELFRGKRLMGSNHASVVPGSGVDIERFQPVERAAAAEAEQPPTVLLFARMLWSKGIGVLVEASRQLSAEGVEHRVRLAGKPHPSNPGSIPEKQLRIWSAAGDVEWLGHVDDVPAELARADIVCLPTYYREGLPMTLIEAAASGCPLISADVPGCREIVRDGVTGLLVPPRDVAALAEALRRLILDAQLRTRLGAEARRVAVEEYSTEVFNQKLFDVYRGLCGERWPADAAQAASAALPQSLRS